jgi:hypothetical protein
VNAESVIVELLAGRDPGRAGDFFLAWGEQRTASWANAARDARVRAASEGHLKQLRGQLRYHLGEVALGVAARSAGVGAIPMPTRQPGGTFTVARLGRFALVSLAVRRSGGMPRPSSTRDLLSEPNSEIDPQGSLLGEPASARGATELAYLGCLVAVPSKRDPSVPSELILAVPTAAIRDWMVWLPLHCVHVLLNNLRPAATRPAAADVPDLAFPTLRLPKRDTKEDKGA